MAPIPEYDTYLALHFPDLTTWLSTSSHLGFISSISQTSSSLLIAIKTPRTDFSPWTSTETSTQPSIATASSSRPSTSTSCRSPPPPSRTRLPPTSLWLPLEQSLASIYSAATREFLRSGRVLANVDVVIEEMRGLPVCPPAAGRLVNWTYKEESCSPTPPHPTPDTQRGASIYPVVALGGTFDHLHAGHKILLTMATSIASTKIIVGVSDDPLLGNKKYREWLQSIQERIVRVENFLELVRPTVGHQVVALQDVYGPTSIDPDIQALVVSQETKSGGQAINKLRSERSLSVLETFVINLVSDDGSTDAPIQQTGSIAATNDYQGVIASDQVKVAVETKMGSTGIREWISKQHEQHSS